MGMYVVNGKEREVVEILRPYGLNKYEAKAYFTLLVEGEAKVGHLARKASVPKSKIYEVLESLNDKGFAEVSSDERPLTYKVVSLDTTTEKAKAGIAKSIKELEKNKEKLKRVLEAFAPIHRQHEAYRLFAPRYRTWKKARTNLLEDEPTSSEVLLPSNDKGIVGRK
jgi:sugar-specific transcriptional regulator TrmB